LVLVGQFQSAVEKWRERGKRIASALLDLKLRLLVGLALMVIALVLTKSRMGSTSFFLVCWLRALFGFGLTSE